MAQTRGAALDDRSGTLGIGETRQAACGLSRARHMEAAVKRSRAPVRWGPAQTSSVTLRTAISAIRQTAACTRSLRATIASLPATLFQPMKKALNFSGRWLPMPAQFVGRECRGSSHRHLLEPGVDGHGSNPSLRAGRGHPYDHDRTLQKLSGRTDGTIDPRLEQSKMNDMFAVESKHLDQGA